ncbi:MAG: FAD-dependent monooxygenase [Paracoccaceae bacterium]
MASPKIVIVGAGPTGLVSACLLRLRGYDPIVLEKRPTSASLPAAHVINIRTLEVFAEIGVVERVLAEADKDAFSGYVSWVESMAGREFGLFKMVGTEVGGDRPLAAFQPANIPQNRVEALLLSRLRELGGEVRFGHCVTAASQRGGQVNVTVQTDAGVDEIVADWVIGCDGAGSTIRRAAGIEMIGPRSLARFMTIYFTANVDHLLKGRYGILYWICGPEARGVFISFDPASRHWAMLVPIGDLPLETFDAAQAGRIVQKAIGDDTVPITIDGLSGWNMSAQVADAYRRERIILAGDACHRFPPTGGLGLNTGVQDAQNLVWKLDAVIRGRAPETLLDSYQQERQPIAQHNTDHSVSNMTNMVMIDEALGFATLAPIMAGAGKGPRQTWPAELVGTDGATPEAAAKRARIQAAIDAQAPHFSHGAEVDLGFVYAEGAILRDQARPGGSASSGARVGGRLPFASASPGFAGSTLADVEPEGLTLFANGPGWEDAAAAAGRLADLPVALRPLQKYGRHAAAIMAVPEGGAVIVRPDGHVVWRTEGRSADAVQKLIEALAASHGRAVVAPA